MKYISLKTILRMDTMIQRKSTGNPERFAKRVELSRSAFFEYIAYMRNELMVDVLYNSYSETYYYGERDLCSVLGCMRCSECRDGQCGDQGLTGHSA